MLFNGFSPQAKLPSRVRIETKCLSHFLDMLLVAVGRWKSERNATLYDLIIHAQEENLNVMNSFH